MYLMFSNAFPDAIIIPLITRDALVVAVKCHQSTSRIHQHLLNDKQYVIDMSPLVSHCYAHGLLLLAHVSNVLIFCLIQLI